MNKWVIFLTMVLLPLQAAASDELIDRRVKLADTMGDYSLLVMFPESHKHRTHDQFWPYRQSKDFHYLTDDINIGSHLMMIKVAGKISEHFFAKLSDPRFEVWDGKLPSIEDLKTQTGIDKIYGEKKFTSVMNNLLQGRPLIRSPDTRNVKSPYVDFYHKLLAGEVELWLELGQARNFASTAPLTRAQKFAGQIRQQYPEIKIRNITPFIRVMRQVKSESERVKLQKAITITSNAHLAALKSIQSATYEYEVEAAIEASFRSQGACCPSFMSIVAGGANGTILHYSANNDKLNKKDIMVIDIGAEFENYSADITRTIPVGGKFSEDQAAIYNLVLKAQRDAIAGTRAGSNFGKISTISEDVLAEGLLRLGLIATTDKKQVRSYVLHGLGHGLGLDVHDALDRYSDFAKNMVITVEPGIYVRKHDVVEKAWYKDLNEGDRASIDKALDRYNGIGVRIEDDILITDGDPIIMSSGSPVTVKEIEAMMAKLK